MISQKSGRDPVPFVPNDNPHYLCGRKATLLLVPDDSPCGLRGRKATLNSKRPSCTGQTTLHWLQDGCIVSQALELRFQGRLSGHH